MADTNTGSESTENKDEKSARVLRMPEDQAAQYIEKKREAEALKEEEEKERERARQEWDKLREGVETGTLEPERESPENNEVDGSEGSAPAEPSEPGAEGEAPADGEGRERSRDGYSSEDRYRGRDSERGFSRDRDRFRDGDRDRDRGRGQGDRQQKGNLSAAELPDGAGCGQRLTAQARRTEEIDVAYHVGCSLRLPRGLRPLRSSNVLSFEVHVARAGCSLDIAR